jgi:hypothetical protein
MNQDNFYAKRLQIIRACYSIQSETNTILEAIKTLPESEASNILAEYIKESKIMRFKPYLEKILSDIREIKHNTQQFKAF